MSQLVPFEQKTSVSADVFSSIFKGVSTLEKKFIEKFPHLSFKGGKFHGIINGDSTTFKDEEGVPVNRLDVIVVGIPQGRSNVLFPKYDPDNPAAPLCSSVNGRVPDKDVKEPFSNNCQTCEKRIKVRGDDGKERSPCQQQMNIAVVVNGQEDKIYKVKLPITAIYNKESENSDYKAWDQYADYLRKNGVMHPAQVVTRISFDPDSQYPRPVFKAVGRLTDEMLQGIASAIQSPITKEIVEGSPEQLGTPEDAPKQLQQDAVKTISEPVKEAAKSEPVVEKVDQEAEIRARLQAEMEAKIRAEIEAKMIAEKNASVNTEVVVEKSEPAPKVSKKKAVVVESDADLDAALADW